MDHEDRISTLEGQMTCVDAALTEALSGAPRAPRIAGYRRLAVCGVVLVVAVASGLDGGDLSAVLLAVLAAYSGPDAMAKLRSK